MRALERAAMVGAAQLMLAGCGHLPFGHRAVPRGGETITFARAERPLSAPPPCKECRAFTITLGPDGQGILDIGTGTYASEHRFRASPVQATAFARRLKPYRPNGTIEMRSGKLCHTFMTDGDQTEITWTSAGSRPAHLLFNDGCDPDKHRKMATAIASAPSLLPIGHLLGNP